VAIWALAAYTYHARVWQLALLGFAQTTPLLSSGLIGPVIDRVGAKAAAIAGLAASALIGILLAISGGEVQLVVLAAPLTAANACFTTAIDTMPRHVPSYLSTYMLVTWMSGATNAAVVLGPLIASALLSIHSITGVFLTLAGVSGISALLISLVPLHDSRCPRTTPQRGPRRRIQFRGTVRDPVSKTALGLTLIVWLTYGVYISLEPVYVRDILHDGATIFGLLQTAFGIGLVCFSPIVAFLGKSLQTVRGLAAVAVTIAFTETLYISTNQVVVAFGGCFAWGCAVALYSGPSQSILLTAAGDGSTGRAMAAFRLVQAAGQTLGLGIVGTIASSVGTRMVLWITALILAVWASRTYWLSPRPDISNSRQPVP
jgi:MFS family permease